MVVPSERPDETIARFSALPQIVAVLEREARRAVGLTLDGIRVVLVVVSTDTFGTELVRATGSAEYVEALGPLPTESDEAGVFAALGLQYCPPELRELPAARPPEKLVELSDIRGDPALPYDVVRRKGIRARDGVGRAGPGLHVPRDLRPHTERRGGSRAGSDELRRQGEEIATVNAELAPFRLLRGVECDIRRDGTLDVARDVLAELEWVQLSLHAGQRRPRDELTRIVTEAMRDPAVSALSHPTGRILNHRPENALDLDEVFSVAKATGVAVEVNGLPDRLDLFRRPHTRGARGRCPDRPQLRCSLHPRPGTRGVRTGDGAKGRRNRRRDRERETVGRDRRPVIAGGGVSRRRPRGIRSSCVSTNQTTRTRVEPGPSAPIPPDPPDPTPGEPIPPFPVPDPDPNPNAIEPPSSSGSPSFHGSPESERSPSLAAAK